ncbi:unnamed protein product [Prunus armeniaca]
MLQSVTALSTTEAKYMALTKASKEALRLTRLTKEFEIAQDLVVIQSDSQSAICLVKNQVFHERSKHIDVQYHRIRDWVNDGDIAIEKVHVDEKASDCLTKPITTEKFRHYLSLLNLVFRLAKVDTVDVGSPKDVEGVKETYGQKSCSCFDWALRTQTLEQPE